MPPPNVSGDLHLGSVLFVTLEDVLTRWHRMRQEPTLWLPGQDHAAIATQNVVERELAREGVSRHDLGREKFLERVWEWVNEYRGKIRDQLKRLGASCDWTRERFTLDPGPAKAVRTTFVNLYNDGLIYRGERIVNWCPALSHRRLRPGGRAPRGPGPPLVRPLPAPGRRRRRSGEYITIATTRPETIVADVAVAVNPADERYRSIVGRNALLPIIERVIPVIADEAVDPAFGTGALKITPGHDPVDFEVGQRHGLETIVCIALDATMSEEAGPYKGMDRFECRTAIVKDLEEGGYLVKTEPYTHSLGHCQRCHTLIEPLVSKQWFVRMAPLAAPAIEAVTGGRIQFVPERFTKVYLNWMENIRDWCISRQLWLGHPHPRLVLPRLRRPDGDRGRPRRLPALRLASASSATPTCSTPGSRPALWPHSTLGWPDETEDLRYFYPTSVMETGYDIIFFWVARMIMMGLYNMKEIPFRTVYLHGLVRDEHGEKISKSKVTTKHHIPSPWRRSRRYGADALRYALMTAGTPGNDIRISEQRMEAGRNFANKLWNAARFVIGHLDGEKVGRPSPDSRASMPLEDRWIMSRLNRVTADVDQAMTDFQLGEAGRQVHDFLWGEYCDWYLEMAKVRLATGDRSPLPVLVHVLDAALRLLHPFMPFVTEAAWQSLSPHLAEPGAAALIVAPYPSAERAWRDDEAEERAQGVIDVIRAIRNIRAEHGVEPARHVEAYVIADGMRPSLEASEALIVALARVRPLHIVSRAGDAPQEAVVTAVLKDSQVVLPMGGMFDLEAERQRLEKQIAAAEAEVERLQGKLANRRVPGQGAGGGRGEGEGEAGGGQARLAGLRERLQQIA